MDRPARRNNERNNNINGARFNFGEKGFIISDAVFLRKTPNDPSSFVTS
jgi:hypothetical protein